MLFLAISVELARFFSVENAERGDAVTLIEAEARGDASAMLTQLDGCREQPSCVATVRENATTLERAGAPKILSLKSETAYALGGKTGKTRLAWAILGGTPVVQCIDVRRSGNVLSGIDVHLLSISAPIANQADC